MEHPKRAGEPRPEWIRDGTVMLFGVVMALRDRQPWAFMGWGGGLLGIRSSSEPSRPTSESEEIDRCRRLARTAGHRAGVAPDDLPSLTSFLIGHRMTLPVQAAVRRDIDLGLSGSLYNWSASAQSGPLDLEVLATLGQVTLGEEGKYRPPRRHWPEVARAEAIVGRL